MLKRGLSNIVSTVLLILLAVAGIAIVWVVVLNTLGSVPEQDTGILLSRFDIDSRGVFVDDTLGYLQATISRGGDNADLSGLKFRILSSSGEYLYDVGSVPSPLGSMIYVFDTTGLGAVSEISLVPVASAGNLGNERKFMITASNKKQISSANAAVFYPVSGAASVNKIDSCPYSVSQPNAIYALEGNLTSSGSCIDIGADNVVLLGNGFTILGDGTGDGISDASGLGRNNVTIKGFGIDGFGQGIFLYPAQDTKIIQNTVLRSAGAGIVLSGDHNKVISNVVDYSGGDGIYIDTSLSNTLSYNTVRHSLGNGLTVFAGDSGVVSYNAVDNSSENGIYLYKGTSNVVEFNSIKNNRKYAVFNFLLPASRFEGNYDNGEKNLFGAIFPANQAGVVYLNNNLIDLPTFVISTASLVSGTTYNIKTASDIVPSNFSSSSPANTRMVILLSTGGSYLYDVVLSSVTDGGVGQDSFNVIKNSTTARIPAVSDRFGIIIP